ncbi:hypothetical protein JW905_18405 [bacterium]|nr:hypothetical protein [candidate division CSSED10-310 bacterium]
MKKRLWIIIGFLLATACSPDIHDLGNLPERYRNSIVHLTGEVTSVMQLPEAVTTFYMINDGSGQIWVASKKEPPAVGDVLSIEGRFMLSATIETQNFTFLVVEQKRQKRGV